MKKSFLPLIILAALAAGWFSNDLTEYFGHKGDSGKTESVQTKERKIKYWWDPMMPEFKSDKPGKSPMGMDMVPVYEDGEESASGSVKVDSGVIQTIGVRTAKAEKRDISREIQTVGTVEPDEQQIHKINPRVSGWIEKMFVDSTGTFVKKDEMLLSLYSPELVSTEEEYLIALGFKREMKESSYSSIVESSSKLAASARERLRNFSVPEHQIREIEKTGKIYKSLHIHTPFAGVVTKLNVREGAYVTPDTVLYDITDLSTVWINANVYEYEISWIKNGDKVQIAFTALPGKVYEGVVTYIYPFLDEMSRTMKVRVVVKNPSFELKPEMFANVKIMASPKSGALTIPTEAILYSQGKKIVLIAEGEGKFHPIEIVAGVEVGGYTEILSGLQEGDEIVTSSQFLLDSESRLMVGDEEEGARVQKPESKGQEEGTSVQEPESKVKDEEKMNHDTMDHSKM